MTADQTDVFILAGEPSGDLWGGLLAGQLRSLRPELTIRGVGGERMRESGVDLLLDSREWGTIGLHHVLPRIPSMLAVFGRLKRHFRHTPPRMFVPIDFGAFNMRLARFARRQGVTTLYYFPPSSWSRTGRSVDHIAAVADYLASPFPWAAQRLRDAGAKAVFTGHPIVDLYSQPGEAGPLPDLPEGRPRIGVLPGSRHSELRYILPHCLRVLKRLRERFPDMVSLISVAPGLERERYEAAARDVGLQRYLLVPGARDVLSHSDVAMVKAGTATLEAAAAGCPFVVVHRGSDLMHLQFALMRLNLAFVAMPSIILQRRIVPECYRWRMPAEDVAAIVARLWDDQAERERIRADLAEAMSHLGPPGASERAARFALSILDGAPCLEDATPACPAAV